MAGRKPLIRIGGDVSEARKAIRDLRDDARFFGQVKEEARLQIQTDAAEARLQLLNDRLARFGQQEQTATVKIASARAAAEIDRIKLKLDKLSHDGVTVDVKVRQSLFSGLSGAGSRIGGSGLTGFVGTAIGAGTSAVAGIAGAAGSAVQSVAGLIPGLSSGAAAMAGMATETLIVIPLLALFAAGVVAVVGVLGALIASLTAAVAGAALLAGAFGAAMAPAALLVVAAFSKLVTIFGALKTSEQQHVQNTAAMQAAAQQRAAAQDELAQAIKNVADQRVAALQAEQDAARALPRDALGIDQARLGIEQAKEAIRQFRLQAGLAGSSFNSSFAKFTDVAFHPSTKNISGALGGQLDKSQELELEQLILNQRQAVFGLSDALEKLKRDRQTDANFAKNGLAAYSPYASALTQVARAQEHVDTATRAATKAQATQEGKLSTLTPRERALAAALGRIKDGFEKAFGPAVDRVLSGIVRGVGFVAKAFESPGIRTALARLGSALGSAFARIGRFFADPANVAAISTFIGAATTLVKPLTTLFITFAKVIRDLALDTLPALIRGVKTFAANVAAWEKQNGGAKNFRSTVKGLISSFSDWVQIGKGLSLIILAFLRGGKNAGDSFAGSLGQVLIKWGKFLNTKKGQQGILDFFSSVKRLIKDVIVEVEHLISLWKAVGKVTGGITKLSNGSASDLPLIGTPIKLFGTLKKLFGGHATGGLVGGTGRGDIVPSMLEPGEFIIRRAVVDAIGLPALMSLNAGAPAAMAAAGGSSGPAIGHQENHFHITTAGGGQMHPDLVFAQIEQRLAALGNG